MKRFFIEEARYGVGDGGIACGPVDAPIVGEVKIVVDGKRIFYTLAEACGLPNFYISDESYFEKFLDMDLDEDEIETINEYFVETGDYYEIEDNKDEEWFDIYRYLIYVVRADYDACDRFIKETKGKYLDEIMIPEAEETM